MLESVKNDPLMMCPISALLDALLLHGVDDAMLVVVGVVAVVANKDDNCEKLYRTKITIKH